MRAAKIAVAAIAPLLMIALAGCADDASGSTNGAGATNSERADAQDQMLKFTECLREHGLDVPDPDESGRFIVPFGGSRSGNGPDPKTREAMEACQEFAPMRGGDLDELRNDPEFQDAQLRFAQCMREHGIDMPDPGAGGGGIMIGGKDDNIPQEQMEAAIEACDPIIRDFLNRGEDK